MSALPVPRSLGPRLLSAWVVVLAFGCADFEQAPADTEAADTAAGSSDQITSLPVTGASVDDGPGTSTAGADTTAGTDAASADSPEDTRGTDAGTQGSDTTADTTAGMGACGDGTIDLREDCDGAQLGGVTCVDVVGFAGELSCADDCTYDTSGCIAGPMPGVGQVVITEIMKDPDALNDSDAEWFEVHNPTAMRYDLFGCWFGSDGNAGFLVETPLGLAPGAYISVARSEAPGFEPDHVFTGVIELANGGSDSVFLECDDTVIDLVVYDNANFPNPTGASMTLDPNTLDSVSNDNGGNWCEATSPLGGEGSDLGTPGAANDDC